MVTPEEIEQPEAFDAQGARVLSRPPVDSRQDAVSGFRNGEDTSGVTDVPQPGAGVEPATY
jgi:hypothetical protein